MFHGRFIHDWLTINDLSINHFIWMIYIGLLNNFHLVNMIRLPVQLFLVPSTDSFTLLWSGSTSWFCSFQCLRILLNNDSLKLFSLLRSTLRIILYYSLWVVRTETWVGNGAMITSILLLKINIWIEQCFLVIITINTILFKTVNFLVFMDVLLANQRVFQIALPTSRLIS